jgi:hypothetical protein
VFTSALGSAHRNGGRPQRRRRVAMTLVAFILALGPAATAADRDEIVAARQAEAWLALVDAHKYGESWDAASTLFRDTVARDMWIDAVGAVRNPLGKPLSRHVKSMESRTSLPGAPDGKYVIIQYDASFEHKKNAVETITPMLEEDGSWKVTGYFFK